MFLSAAVDRKRSPRYVCEILDLLTELYTTSGTTYFGIEYAQSQADAAHRAIHHATRESDGVAFDALVGQSEKASSTISQ